MQSVTAKTAQWPKNAPEQPATAMGAKATRHQGASFMRGDLRLFVESVCVGDFTTRDELQPNFYRWATTERKLKGDR
jgi:hypothetical protein